MQRDIRTTPLFGEVQAFYEAVRKPGTGQISDALEVQASPEGRHAVFTAVLADQLDGGLPTRIAEIDLGSGDTRVLTFGPNMDRLPKYSPDGRTIAFLSDRHAPGDFQLHLLDRASGAARSALRLEGWVEYFHWSPDGQRILLAVAGHGADLAGAQGAVTSAARGDQLPAWMPSIETGAEEHRWRTAWVYEIESGEARRVSPDRLNIWEAAWCGPEAIAAVASPGPGEGLWYLATLHHIDIRAKASRELFKPATQIGLPAATPSGNRLAIVEALCSDRYIVAGDLHLIDPRTGEGSRIDTHGVDVTHTEWRSEHELMLAGHRGLETVIARYDARSGAFSETWASTEIGTVGRFASAAGLDQDGGCVLVGEGFSRAPEIAVIRRGEYRSVKSWDAGYGERIASLKVERLAWKAPDGLEIQGWLLKPPGAGPHPTVMYAHGGPVGHWRPMWLGRTGAWFTLVKHGYAVFLPNPRGSSGRGQPFAHHVLGDMGGADTHDFLSGLDHLVARKLADPTRLGVTGGSYGGYIASWLITQDTRFKAAVPVAPVTNYVTEHLISNIPHWPALFLKDSYRNPGGKYYTRSPIMFAHRAKTPTLNICGALDRSAPPEEALQFHHALLENGVKSVLVTYPKEGHGVREFPAVVDYVTRVVGWFEEHMPASAGRPETKSLPR